MNVLKRAAALAFGLLLLWTLITSRATWLFLFLLVGFGLAALAGLRHLAKREAETFGQWQDYLLVGLLGATGAALVSHLVSGAPLTSALLLSVAAGLEGGGALGAIAWALRRRNPQPVERSSGPVQ